jgi:hypothetical protein
VGAVIPINILTGVDRDGERYTISGEGETAIGPVTVTGTVDADGNINLEIYVAAFQATATYTGKNVVNIEEIITGTYVGDVIAGAPVGSNVDVVIKREDNKYKLQIHDSIAGFLFHTEFEITVLQNSGNYVISSNPSTATLSNDNAGMTIPTSVEITSGTITAAGTLDFNIEIQGLTNLGAPSNTATYTGQKLENLARAAAGTYEGVVTILGTPVSSPDAEITLTVVDRTTVRWTTSTQVNLPSPYGTQTFEIAESDNFMLTVSGSSGTYTLTGQGSTILGSVNVTSDSKVEGKNISLTMDAGLSVPLIFTGQKQ